MVKDAARFYKQQGDVDGIFGARYNLLGSYIFEGLPPPPEADFGFSFSKGSLAEWKQRLFIGERGEDWEQHFEAET